MPYRVSLFTPRLLSQAASSSFCARRDAISRAARARRRQRQIGAQDAAREDAWRVSRRLSIFFCLFHMRCFATAMRRRRSSSQRPSHFDSFMPPAEMFSLPAFITGFYTIGIELL